jgi:Sigma-70, region 4
VLPRPRAIQGGCWPARVNVARLLLVLVIMTAIRDSACGRTAAAVARQLGIPDGTARSRLHYALHALRQHLHGLDATAA